MNEPSEPSCHRDQEPAIVGVRYALDSVWLGGYRIEFLGARLPSPHPCPQSDPQIPLAVLKQAEHTAAKTDHLRIAPDAALLNFTEFPPEACPAGPDRAF